MTGSHDTIIADTRAWVNRVVIGLNLCPFARAVEQSHQIRYVATHENTDDSLRAVVCDEVRLLLSTPPAEVATTLLILPTALVDFRDFNDFLGIAEQAMTELAGDGVLQLASFHPLYQFAGTAVDDLSNATNRSPYPTLHLLREEAISRVLATFPNPDSIFDTNIRTLKALGTTGWAELQAQCRRDAAGTE